MSTPVIGFEDDMGQAPSRDYGQEAMRRRIGVLAKQRREELGLGRIPFAKQAGIGSDRTVFDFERGNNLPQPLTLAKLERSLGWRRGAIAELMGDERRKVSDVAMEDLDEHDSLKKTGLAQFSLPEILREAATRIEALQQSLGVQALPDLGTKDLYGMAASGHIPEHLEKEFEGKAPGGT